MSPEKLIPRYPLATLFALLLLAACNSPTQPQDAPNSPTTIDSFGATPNPSPANVGTQFSWTVLGQNLTCKLDVEGDGTFDYTVESCTSQSRVVHTYGTQGSFGAKLTVTGADGLTRQQVTPVKVTAPNIPPVPQLGATQPANPEHPFEILFTWTVQDFNADITHCRFDAESDGVWEYDNLCSGLPAISTGAQQTTGSINTGTTVSYRMKHRYARRGKYRATLEAADPHARASTQIDIRVPYNTPPRIDYLNGLGRPDRSAQVRFGASDDDGDPITCTLTIESVGRFTYPKCREIRRDFFFAQAGRYQVTLEVADPYTTTRKSIPINCSVDCNYYEILTTQLLGHPMSSVRLIDVVNDEWMVSAGVPSGDMRLYRRNSLNQWETLPGYWLVDATNTDSSVAKDASFNPAASLIAVATTYDTVQIWARSGNNLSKVQELDDHTDDVLTVDFNYDGTLLASGSSDGTIRLYTVSGNTATFSKELFGASSTSPAGSVHDLRFDHDSNLLASGHDSNKAIIWDDLTTTPTPTEIAHSYAVKGVAINPAYTDPSTPFLATSSYDSSGQVRFWNLDGTENGSGIGSSYPGRLNFSSDGSLIAVKDGTYATAIINVSQRDRVGHPSVNAHGTERPFFGLNDTQLIASNSYTVGLWTVTGPGAPGYSGGYDGYGVLSNSQLLAPRSIVRKVAIRPQGDLLAVSDEDENIQLFDLHSTAPVGRVISSSADFGSLAFHPDGRVLAAGDDSGVIRIWDISVPSNPSLISTNNDYTGYVQALAYSPQGNLLASAGRSGSDYLIYIWDEKTGNRIETLSDHTSNIRDVVWAPDGSWLASASEDKTIRIWDTRTWQVRHILEGHNGYILDIDVSPDGSRLVSVGRTDNSARLWDTATGRAIGKPMMHSDWVFTVAWSPDGKVIATGDDDSLVRLWDPETQQLAVPAQLLDGGRGSLGIPSLAFSPSGQYLVAGTENRTLNILTYNCRAN
jgi:WD40 repeat protein